MRSTLDFSVLKRQFDEDGFVHVPQFLGEGEISELTSVLEKLISDKVPTMPPQHAFYEIKNDPTSLKQLQDLHQYDPYFQSLLTESTFEKLVIALLGEKVIGKNIQYFNKPAKIGLPTPPHQDGYYFKISPTNAATLWLALEDVDEENGCVRYIRGSHHGGMRPHNRSNILGFSQGITDYGERDYSTEIKLPVKAGDLLAHHAMTIHRADGNRSKTRSRKAIGFIYFAASAIEDVDAKEAYRKELESDFFKN